MRRGRCRRWSRGPHRPRPATVSKIERQYLSQYLGQHYVDANSLDLTSIDYSIGGSVTLEYALDDFAIAQLAQALHDSTLAQSMMQRAHNWEYLFNPATGRIQARGSDGSFPAGPAFQTSMLEPGGQLGFEEGNAIQYTWSVPQDLASLAALMGGDGQAQSALDTFFSSLNAGRDLPYDWAGNEPSLWTPWEYDYFGAPSKTQATVRTIADRLYADAPVDEPGNDDLGAIASWYVWAAMGMYPVTPGTADLALASPLFPKVVLTLPDGRHLVLDAPGASTSTPYVHSLAVTGVGAPKTGACSTGSDPRSTASWDRPWLPASVIQSGGQLTFTLGATPDLQWGSGAAEAPPSYPRGGAPAVGFTFPSGGLTMRVGQPATVLLGVASTGTTASAVQWSANGAGLAAAPATGQLLPHPTAPTTGHRASDCDPAPPAEQALTVTGMHVGSYVLHVGLTAASGVPLPPVVLDVQVTA